MSHPSGISVRAAVAVTRFGPGARPGELQAAAGDPQGWLRDQIQPRGADTPPFRPSQSPRRSS